MTRPESVTERPLDLSRLDVDRLASVLRRVEQLEPRDVAHEIAASGVLVVVCAPGTKDPMLARQHIDSCSACQASGLHGMKDHGATTDQGLLDHRRVSRRA